MYQLVYVSRKSEKYKDIDLLNIIERAQVNNKEHNLTGILIARGDYFVQLLEGDKKDIDGLLGILRKDDRHQDINVIFEVPDGKQLFKEWKMKLKKVGPEEYEIFDKILPWDDIINNRNITTNTIFRFLGEFYA